MPEPFSLTVRAGIRHTDDTGPFWAAKSCLSQTSLAGVVDQTNPASEATGLTKRDAGVAALASSSFFPSLPSTQPSINNFSFLVN
ncbi:MAG TPA: hypothetical protein VFA10_24890 [Ktedonobacteraceae bacterium]|nr:hypothetical protein [Ktedonobacteraceae bacterium]